MINIPIYRAKKIDGDELVEGHLNPFLPTSKYKYYYIVAIDEFTNHTGNYEIDINTLAIHFPNMIDKNGKKIFASLSEDGVGGDIIIHDTIAELQLKNGGNALYFTTDGIFASYKHPLNRIRDTKVYEAIGIHKGE